MATTVVASCGFIQSSLHSLFNFPLTVPAEEEPRRDLHKHISGHLEMLKLLFYPLFIVTMVGLNTLQACFLNRWVWAPKQTWLIWKSCQHRRWRKRIRSSGYRSPIWHDTERKPGSHSGICHSFFTEASRNSAISWSLFQDHIGAADFFILQGVFEHLLVCWHFWLGTQSCSCCLQYRCWKGHNLPSCLTCLIPQEGELVPSKSELLSNIKDP